MSELELLINQGRFICIDGEYGSGKSEIVK